jgi:hypothetical protein
VQASTPSCKLGPASTNHGMNRRAGGRLWGIAFPHGTGQPRRRRRAMEEADKRAAGSSRRAVGPPGRSRQPGVGWHAWGTRQGRCCGRKCCANDAGTARGEGAAPRHACRHPLLSPPCRFRISISSRCSCSPTPARGKPALSSASIGIGSAG